MNPIKITIDKIQYFGTTFEKLKYNIDLFISYNEIFT